MLCFVQSLETQLNEELAAHEAELNALKEQRDRLLVVIGEEMEKPGPTSPRVGELLAELAEIDSAIQNLWEPSA